MESIKARDEEPRNDGWKERLSSYWFSPSKICLYLICQYVYMCMHTFEWGFCTDLEILELLFIALIKCMKGESSNNCYFGKTWQITINIRTFYKKLRVFCVQIYTSKFISSIFNKCLLWISGLYLVFNPTSNDSGCNRNIVKVS